MCEHNGAVAPLLDWRAGCAVTPLRKWGTVEGGGLHADVDPMVQDISEGRRGRMLGLGVEIVSTKQDCGSPDSESATVRETTIFRSKVSVGCESPKEVSERPP